MQITDIKFRHVEQAGKLKALVSVTVDGDLAVHDIKVIEGPQRLFVAMPSRKDESGTFRDIAHPITPQARKQLEDAVLGAYEQYLAQQPTSPEADSGNLLQTARQTALWEQNLYNAPDITYLD